MIPEFPLPPPEQLDMFYSIRAPPLFGVYSAARLMPELSAASTFAVNSEIDVSSALGVLPKPRRMPIRVQPTIQQQAARTLSAATHNIRNGVIAALSTAINLA